MLQYRIKGSADSYSMMEIIKEKSDGYDICITREYENYSEQSSTFMSRELFDSCLRTGYIIAEKAPVGQKTA